MIHNNDEKLIKLGEEARKLGSSDNFQEILQEIITDQHTLIEKSQVTDVAEREAAYMMIKAIDAIRTQLTIAHNRGERAKARRPRK